MICGLQLSGEPGCTVYTDDLGKTSGSPRVDVLENTSNVCENTCKKFEPRIVRVRSPVKLLGPSLS